MIVWSSIETEPERKRKRDDKELANMIMEADKPQVLKSASWRPRKANGLVSSESRGLRMRRIGSISSSLQAGQRARKNSCFSMSH